MSIHSESKSNKPFKTVTVEYFEEFVMDDKWEESERASATRLWPYFDKTPVQRRIRVITTTRDYNMGSSKGDPIVSVTYSYL